MQYLSVGHPTYFTGLDYIYEDRGEVMALAYLLSLMKLVYIRVFREIVLF